MAVWKFTEAFLNGKPLTLLAASNLQRDFTYIDDTVEGIILALTKFDAVKNHTINLAFGEGTRLVDLAKSLKRLLKSKSDVTLSPSRTGEVVRYVADITKAREMLGYDPKVSFKDGIQKSVEWYTRQN